MPLLSWVQHVAGAVAGMVSLAAFLPYAIRTIRRPTIRPNRATWWVWMLAGILIASSNYQEGVRAGMWLPLSYVLGPAILAVVSLKYGEGGWSKLDRACIAAALLSVIPWVLTKSALTTLLINIGIDAIGALPTIRKSYREPEAEDPVFWYLAFTAAALNLLAIQEWRFAEVVYPLYMFVLMGGISALELRGFLRHRTASQ